MTRETLLKNLSRWDSDCEYHMMDSLQGHAEFFKDEVNSGISKLWEVDNGEAYFITRTEHDTNGKKVLVVCCYEGRDIRKVYKLIETSSIKLGYFAIRFHTKKKGMARFAKWHDFVLLEDRNYEKVFIKYLQH